MCSIETGRQTIPKTPINFRIYSFCDSNEADNEIHFLVSCQFIEDRLRLKLFLKLPTNIVFLNGSVPSVCRSVAFIFQCYNIFESMSYLQLIL